MSEVLRLATIGIDGMTCSSCSGTVESALKSVKGVKSANVNLTTNTALVSYDSPKNIVRPVKTGGFARHFTSTMIWPVRGFRRRVLRSVRDHHQQNVLFCYLLWKAIHCKGKPSYLTIHTAY